MKNNLFDNDRLDKALEHCHKLRRAKKTGIIYLLESSGFYKIGITCNLAQRLWAYKVHSPIECKLISHNNTVNYKRIEKRIKRKYRHLCIHGEWFRLDSISIDDVKSMMNDTTHG
jgi:hypothetical protein